MTTTNWLEAIPENWTGTLRLRVRGRSMYPTLRPGDELMVESVTPADLRPGDWLVVRSPSGALIHRFLRFDRQGRLLTKGDGHRRPDPPWSSEALLGRVVAFIREGKTLSVESGGWQERMRTLWHRTMAFVWHLLGRRGALLLALLVLLLPLAVRASVVLSSFEATPQDDSILITWETASETNMAGFYVRRSLQEDGIYERVSDFIWSEGDIVGWSYDFTDTDVEEDVTYYYKLEAEEADGSVEFHGPISARIGDDPEPTEEPTSEPTDEPTDEPTEEPTDAPPPTATPEPYVNFWAEETDLQAGDCTTIQWQTVNVQAVYLDGRGVLGMSGRTFCPCSDETHTLRVIYNDGSYEDQSITLNVSGTCPAPDERVSATPTPTPRLAATPTTRPAQPTANPTRTPSPTATRASTSPDAAPSPSPTATPISRTPQPSSSPSPTPSGSPGPTPSRTLPPTQDLEGEAVENSTGNGSRAGLIVVLIAGGALMTAGGWGIWKAWKG